MSEINRSYAVGVALIAGGALCWSTAGLIVRGVDAGPWEITFWRSAFMTLALLPLLLARRTQVLADLRAAGWSMVLSGALLAATFIFFILAISYTTVANALFVMACAPLLTAVIGRVFFGEPVQAHTWIAIAAAGGGVALMVWNSLQAGGLIGAVLAFLVAFCFSINANIVRHNRAISMLPGVFLAGLFSAIVAAPFALPPTAGTGEIGLLALLGVVQLGLGLVLFTIGTRTVPAAQAVVIGLLEIVLGPFWVWLAFGEQPGVLALIGGVAVLAAVAGNALYGIAAARGRRARAIA
ncbi:MAG: DMT family transporter [Reyranellaceae bacterium]